MANTKGATRNQFSAEQRAKAVKSLTSFTTADFSKIAKSSGCSAQSLKQWAIKSGAWTPRGRSASSTTATPTAGKAKVITTAMLAEFAEQMKPFAKDDKALTKLQDKCAAKEAELKTAQIELEKAMKKMLKIQTSIQKKIGMI